MATNNKPKYEIFHVRDSNNGGKGYWTKIGAGFENKDGSVNMVFDCIPVDGRCQLRVRQEKQEEGRNEQR